MPINRNILAIETAGDACSVALSCGAQVYQEMVAAPQKQGEVILPLVQAVLLASGLAPQDIMAIAFNVGPGSFTGVRLNTAVAQGVSLGWSIPLLPGCSLQALAYQRFQEDAGHNPVVVCLDARKQEIYVGGYCFHADRLEITIPEQVIAPDKLESTLAVQGPLETPSARDILHFAQYKLHIGAALCEPADVEPCYVRLRVTDI